MENHTKSIFPLLVLGSGLMLSACSEGGSSSGSGGSDDPNAPKLACTEVMYNSGDADSLEWIEIQLASGSAISSMVSAEMRIEGAVEYTFPEGSLAVGERIVVTNDTAAFRTHYPYATYPVRLFGSFSGRLDNAGEVIEIKLSGPGDASCRYSSAPPWPSLAAGNGHSLVYVSGGSAYPESYGASKNVGGNPGGADSIIANIAVRVNEVHPYASTTEPAWVELYNPSNSAVDISGWILADNANGTNGYTIPSGTSIAAGAYLVLEEKDWPTTSGSFYPARNGDDVYLVQTEAGVPTGQTTGLTYPALEDGKSAGVVSLTDGNLARGPLQAPTAGATNSSLLEGDVYISEIHYNPLEGDAEFLEIANRGTTTIDLTSPTAWKIEGIAFSFPAGATLPAGGKIVLVRAEDSDTASFRSANGIASSVPVYAYTGKLSNRGEMLTILKPLAVVASGYAYGWSDVVLYGDSGDWPSEADGDGMSLVRTRTDLPGEDPSAWDAATPSPGK